MSQPAVKKRKTGKSSANGPTITDARFANIQSDPRYRLPGRRQKIKVDKRFARALQDEDFSRKAKVDRYGRPVDTDAEKKRLKRKYDFEEDEDTPRVQHDDSDGDDDNDVQAELRRVEATRDILREGKDMSSSEDETSSDEEEEEGDEVDEVGPGVQDRDVLMGEVSPRLAVVNLDWDNIRAEDLMAVFQSFLPATGRLLKVAVYPSEFGKERLEREEMEGPPKEIFAQKDEDSLVSESDSQSQSEADDEEIKASLIKPDDGSEFNSTALRRYQLDRLRYFYAILTFSSPDTAKAIYDAVDGTEYLSTANFFDLRFVPDETDFSTDTPREECNRIPPGYKPNDFVTDALQHSKVKLTWDAEDNTRKEAQARAFRAGRNEIDENDLKAYLASDTESEEDEQEEKGPGNLPKKEAERQRMRALLGLAPEPVKQEKKKDVPLGNIQITFSSGLSGRADMEGGSSDDEAGPDKKKRNVFENSPEPDETTVEKYVRKEKERKQRRKEKMKANRDGVEPETQDGADDHQDLGFNDPFFGDSTDQPAKSTNKQRKEDRLKRRQEREAEEAANAKERAELETVLSTFHPNIKPSDLTTATITTTNKKSKKNKRHNKDKDKSNQNDLSEGGGGQDSTKTTAVKIDPMDPRFARLYENHEFAIDPTNPRYRPTEGMKRVLEEGRKRRANHNHQNSDKNSRRDSEGKVDDDGVMAVKQKKKSSREKSNRGHGEGSVGAGAEEGVMNLVEKIKRRQKS